MRKITNKILGLALGCLLFSSCSEFDYIEGKNFDEDLVWSEYAYLRKSLAEVYTKCPDVQKHIDGAFLASATDDSEDSNPYSNVEMYNRGAWNQFNNPMDEWEQNYEGIYLANKYIESADTCTLYNYIGDADYDTKLANVTAYRGEARFLRAYFYFELLKRYGGVPLITETKEDLTSIQKPRNSYKEVLDFILAECDSAMVFMPDYNDISSNKDDLGRASDAAALALKSRAALYASSPLNNPTGTFNNYLDSCAIAAAEIITSNNFTLSGVNYEELFTPGSSTHRLNKEVILDFREGKSNDIEKSSFPIGTPGGKGYSNPSQNLVDSYEMVDGTLFDWTNPEMASNPYQNRDPRLAASVLFHGTTVQGRVLNMTDGGTDGPGHNDYFGTKTGYYLKKGVKTELDLVTDSKDYHYWYYFRYAEVLLNYAEAMNELYGPNADPSGYGMTAREAINVVRYRAGIAQLSATLAATQNEFRIRLRNERRVELAFEDHRFWDVRRWNIAESTLGATVKGVQVADTDGVISYTVKEVEDRVFEEKMYFFPIPQSEISSGSPVEQTPDW